MTKEEFLSSNLTDDAPTYEILREQLQIKDKDIHSYRNIFEKELKYIQSLRDIYKQKINDDKNKNKNTKFLFKDFNEFYLWYVKYDKIGKCCYCGVPKTISNESSIFESSKRGRGRVLEVERVVTIPDDKNIYNIDNCRLACHICNNAKSDFITPKNFKYIAKGINELWNELLKEDDISIEFPENSNIWNK
jgi:5-methylcytosine-specific restriction endonuclease McrA